ncbi:hypothetical protein A7978_04530 (plasmid) [Borrelia turicatae]|uniref:Lipoprotein n=2 Tax=Borrelia turicatae TaxID=142 RepID=T1ECK1_BORT9|nr:hypothetical protein [Borrelia turicatae]ADN26461.1 hypothetical protein BTA034 [Borrelia turicatae 91E135]ANF34380.1 hypothetical protein A7978_04530 [Borrelia turicatae]UPA13964.1 hypothetical protein bt91E135_001126 [Borrelia turicatae 91E135]UPA15457.1 hypothetical protein btBTE5EL_001137 [Borrelia turicatae]
MKKVGMVLYIFVLLACEQGDPDSSGFDKVDSNLKKNVGSCDQKMILKPVEQIEVDSRHVAFYKLYKMVNEYKEFLNNRTFQGLDYKLVFKFPIAQIFPVYKNADFIYEGLNYNPIVIDSLEFILYTLNLDVNIVNQDLLQTSQLLEYISDSARLFKTLLNDNLDEATLEWLKVSKTAEELTNLNFHLGEAMNYRRQFIKQLSIALIKIAVKDADRDFVFERLTNDIVGQGDGLRHGDLVELSPSISRDTINLFYVSMKRKVDIVLCLIKN